MTRPHRTLIYGSLVLTTLAVGGLLALPNRISAQGEPAAVPAAHAAATPTLKELLAKTSFMHKATDEAGSKFRVVVETQAGVGFVNVEEIEMSWKASDGSPVKVIYIWCWIASVPEGFKPSEALLAALNQINVDHLVGRVNLNKFGMFRCNTMWLSTADALTLEDEIYMMHNDTLAQQKTLKPFVSESAQEDAAVSAVSSAAPTPQETKHGE